MTLGDSVPPGIVYAKRSEQIGFVSQGAWQNGKQQSICLRMPGRKCKVTFVGHHRVFQVELVMSVPCFI